MKRRHKLGNGWVEIHSNPKHAEDVIRLLGTEGALSVEDHAKYRTAEGKLLYLALDRIDPCYAVGQVSRALSKPTKLDMVSLRRCVRYISGTATASIRLTAGFQDSLNGNMLCHGCRTQGVIATSSCESEFYAMSAAMTIAVSEARMAQQWNTEAANALVESESEARTAQQWNTEAAN
eukprot:826038-Amphidinium_carterae.4